MIKMEVGRCKDCRHWRGCPDNDDGFMVCAMTGSRFTVMREKIKNIICDIENLKDPEGQIPDGEFDSLSDYMEKMPINIEGQTLAYCEEPDTYLATSPYFGCVMWEEQENK